jgi:hypothetical protein
MIIISPYSKKLINGKQNPKNYPYWEELIDLIKKNLNEPIVQVGITGEQQLVGDFRQNLRISELRKLINECRTWVACDSFFQHLCWDEGKEGIVLWGVSDPLIYGHPENINLLADRKYLVENQFLWWEFVEHRNERFVKPKIVLEHLKE